MQWLAGSHALSPFSRIDVNPTLNRTAVFSCLLRRSDFYLFGLSLSSFLYHMELEGLSLREVIECQSIVTCPICLDMLDDGRLLPCTHSFCLNCLIRLNKTSRHEECPKCREITVPPAALLSSLPLNYFANNIVKMIMIVVKKAERHTCLTCSLCTGLLSDPRLLDCGHSFCLTCLRIYQSRKTRKRCPNPKCHKLTIPPKDELDMLPVDKNAQQVVKLINSRSVLNNEGKPLPVV